MNTGINTPETPKTPETPETLTSGTPQMDEVCSKTEERLGAYFGPDWHDPRASIYKWSNKFNVPYIERHPESD